MLPQHTNTTFAMGSNPKGSTEKHRNKPGPGSHFAD